jgi:NAD(P)-dependent dehydrogenase (short-subunit alcohol dehydrogenase family)
VDCLEADLSSQAETRNIVHFFYDAHDRLDVLVNNAGGFFLHRKLSVDGIEMTFALNHLAYFLLTNLLMNALKASSSARVVNVSSGSHLHQHLEFNNLQLTRSYNPIKAYGRSKLANILFTYELARRMEATHVIANALTPGMVATEIWIKGDRWMTYLINPVIKRIAQTPLEGSQTSIFLATSPDVNGITGKYYANKQPVNSDPNSYDRFAAQQLWQKSLELVDMGSTNDQAM